MKITVDLIPRTITLMVAKLLRRLMVIGKHDIILFNELNIWIKDELSE